jgi:hypothetical protein
MVNSSGSCLKFGQNRNNLGSKCARICNIAKLDTLKLLNQKAMDMAFKLHSHKVQLRKDRACRSDLRQNASRGPHWAAGCRSPSNRRHKSGVGAWLVGMTALDVWELGFGPQGLAPGAADLASNDHGQISHCNMWLRGRSYKCQQSVFRVSGASFDHRGKTSKTGLRQHETCSPGWQIADKAPMQSFA